MEFINELMIEVQTWVQWIFEGPQAVFVPLVAGALAIGGLGTLWVITIWLNEKQEQKG